MHTFSERASLVHDHRLDLRQALQHLAAAPQQQATPGTCRNNSEKEQEVSSPYSLLLTLHDVHALMAIRWVEYAF